MAPRLLHYSDLENVYDTPERAGRLAGLLRELDGEDAILAGSGDNTSPGVLALVEDGAQALDFFAAVEPDVETFGNHEFDHSHAALTDLVADSPQTWVSANVWADRERGERFGADAGVVPTTVVEAGGAEIGFVGVTTERTASINPFAKDLEFSDPVEAARDALADLDADYRVVLSHLGRGDEELARELDADAILGGHVPTERADEVDGTLLTRPGDGGSVVLEFDLETGEVTRHRVADDQAHEADANVSAHEGSTSVSVHEQSTAAPFHEGVADAMRERLASAGLDEVVATVEPPIDRAETTLFGGESRLGNFVADAYRWTTGADVGLQNSGGVRTGDALEGEVTAADLVSVTPFEESLVVAQVPGEELRAAFEWAASPDLGFAEDGWWHAQVSGATVAWDPQSHAVESVRIGGEPIDPDGTYSVAMSDYLLHTDDEFPSLDEAHRVSMASIQYEVLVASTSTARPSGRPVSMASIQYEVLVEYARETGIDPEIEGRIREVQPVEREQGDADSTSEDSETTAGTPSTET